MYVHACTQSLVSDSHARCINDCSHGNKRVLRQDSQDGGREGRIMRDKERTRDRESRRERKKGRGRERKRENNSNDSECVGAVKRGLLIWNHKI